MPILRIDYDAHTVSDEVITEFCEMSLMNAMEVYGLSKDYFSVFVRPFSTLDFSVAQIEVECVAGQHEYGDNEEAIKSCRERYASELAERVREWKQGRVDGSIISTVTATPWKVEWIK
mgnify:CR=1 FL=1